MSELSENIKKFRIKRGLTQDELADKLGYKSKSTIAKIELGINDIPQARIKSFADALGVSPYELMGWDDSVDDREARDALYQAKSELENIVSSNPDFPSGKRVEFLFNKLDYDPLIVCYQLDIPLQCYNSWVNNGVLPPFYIINCFLGNFFMSPKDLLTQSELQDYEDQSLDYGKQSPSFVDKLLDEELIQRLHSLTPEEMQKVDAFVQGLIANR